MVTTTAASASFAMANLFQHQINHARRLDSMAEACLSKQLKRFAMASPEESISVSKIFQAESDSSIASLLAQLSAGQQTAKIAQSTPGDLSMEISKVGAAIASVHGLVGGLVALLQQMLKDGTLGVPIQPLAKKTAPKVEPVPVPTTEDHEGDLPGWPEWSNPRKYPTVTIRY
jgi:hypothetical protein